MRSVKETIHIETRKKFLKNYLFVFCKLSQVTLVESIVVWSQTIHIETRKKFLKKQLFYVRD
jgi:hypothetical protein